MSEPRFRAEAYDTGSSARRWDVLLHNEHVNQSSVVATFDRWLNAHAVASVINSALQNEGRLYPERAKEDAKA